MEIDATALSAAVRPARTILVPLDGSERARRALPLAGELARRGGGRLVLFRATRTAVGPGDNAATPGPLPPGAEDEALSDLEEAAAALRQDGVAVETRVSAGAPGDAISRAVAETGARFVLMVSHGRSGPGRWLLGSVTEEVLRRSGAPVVVVPERYAHRWSAAEPLRILVALDGDVVEEALGPACEMAVMAGGDLVLVRAVEQRLPLEGYAFPVGEMPGMVAGPSGYPVRVQSRLDDTDAYLADAADRVRRLVPGVQTRVEVGAVEDALSRAAAATGAHLIAMAVHRRGELAELLLGSRAMATLRRADVPVMMVRPAVTRGPVMIEPRRADRD